MIARWCVLVAASLALTACASSPRYPRSYVESVQIVQAPAPCFGPYTIAIVVNQCTDGACSATATLLYGVRVIDGKPEGGTP